MYIFVLLEKQQKRKRLKAKIYPFFRNRRTNKTTSSKVCFRSLAHIQIKSDTKYATALTKTSKSVACGGRGGEGSSSKS